MEATSVYLYHDARGVLIYVGITKTRTGRQAQHNASAEWWRYVDSQKVEHYDTREEAKARETWLIKNERPVFNRAENDAWERLRAAYLMLFDPASLLDAQPMIRDSSRCVTCDGTDERPCKWLHHRYRFTEYCGSLSCVTCHARYHGYESGCADGHGFAVREMEDRDDCFEVPVTIDVERPAGGVGMAFNAAMNATVGDPTRKMVFLAVASYADQQTGRGAYGGVTAYAEHAQCSRRTAHRHIATLLEQGFIREGNQGLARHIAADRRPTVYDVALSSEHAAAWAESRKRAG